jgi:hypothetical protein
VVPYYILLPERMAASVDNYEREVDLHVPHGMQRLNVTRSIGEYIELTDADGVVCSIHVSDIRRNSGKIRVAVILHPNQRVNDPRKDRR